MFVYCPKLIELVIAHTKKAMIGALLVSAIFIYVYLDYIPLEFLGIWLGAQIVYVTFRLYNAKQLEKYLLEKNDEQLKKHTIYFFIVLVFSAITWTIGTVLGFIFAPAVYQFFSLLMIMGIITASLISVSLLYEIYIVYFLFLILPQFVLMLMAGTHASYATSLLMLIYIPSTIILSKAMSKNYISDIQVAKDLKENTDKLYELSITDFLTKVYNRRYFFETAQNYILTAKRENKELSLLMLDIDFFKSINDTYGHQAGDTVLISLCEEIKAITRESDLFARVGGEEFVLLLANTSYEGAKIIAQKIRSTIQDKVFKHQGTEINVTISIGLASLNTKNDTIEKLYKDVDAKLYLAKENGRNRVY